MASAEEARPSGDRSTGQLESGSPVRVEIWRARPGRGVFLLAALLVTAAALPAISLIPAARSISPAIDRIGAGVLAAPIWHDFMLLATAGMPVEGFAASPIPLTPPSPSPTPTPSLSPSPSVAPPATPSP